MFKYQNADAPYVNHEDVDSWGFKKAKYPGATDLQQGVNWNLSKILLPSCGTIEVDYERDQAKSSWNALAQMNQYNPNYKNNTGDLEMFGNSAYYTSRVAAHVGGTETELVLDPAPGIDFTNWENGMLIIVYISGTEIGTDHTFTRLCYMYRALNIDKTAKTMIIDRHLYIPSGQNIHIDIKGIWPTQGICDGIRVSKLRSNSGSGVKTTAYDYPLSGVMAEVPEAAVPKLFTTPAEYSANQGLPQMYIVQDSHEAGSVYVLPALPGGQHYSNDLLTYSNGMQPDDQIIWSDPFPPGGSVPPYPPYVGVQHSELINFDVGKQVVFSFSDVAGKYYDLYLFYRNPAQPVTTAKRHIEIAVNGAIQASDNIDFPSTYRKKNNNVVKMVKIASGIYMENSSIATIKYDASSSGDVKLVGINRVPNSTNKTIRSIEPMYTTGNTTVIYPTVEVRQTSPDYKSGDNGVNGLTRYNYFTFNDLIKINGTLTSLISSELHSTSKPGGLDPTLKVLTVFDHSSLAGLTKSVQQIKKSGATEKIIAESDKEYAFSEELNRPGIGVVTGLGSDARLGGDKPLGLIQERSIRRDAVKISNSYHYYEKTITDVVRSKPFLVSITDKTDRVPKTTKFGLFDALTGNALATLVTGATSSIKLDIKIPFRFLLTTGNSGQKDFLDNMHSKNTVSLDGGSLVSANNGNVIPDNISLITNIQSAKFTQFSLTRIPPNPLGSSGQTRFETHADFSWNGITDNDFTWPITSTISPTGSEIGPGTRLFPTTYPNWISTRIIDSIDRFSRPLTQFNGVNVPYTLVYHPLFNGVIGKIDNASAKECGVYTCDYEDLENQYFFDVPNGWQKNNCLETPDQTCDALELVSSPVHFGNKSLHVKNCFGPTKYVQVQYNQDYVFSAWILPINGTNRVQFSLGVISNNLCTPTIVHDVVKDGLVSDKWQLVEFKITCHDFSPSTFMRIAIGTVSTDAGKEFYMDDIRFYPAKAQISTFYYDMNMGLPITMVDANNHARYFKYDVFGRLIEKGVFKE
ncbi:MAG: hypothetical protein PHC61_00950 [Chitinivibrionales bacterium]|nr:hypothetical protein [Chitinivibrionales bacterium]